MSISKETRKLIQTRANFACEFCGVTEIDTGGKLTIDHFQPISKGGKDEPDNLLYCCNRCNLYKLSYFPESSQHPVLWNPRKSPFSNHFIELDDGTLHPLTPTGEFTLARLRLNRAPLVAYRQRNRKQTENLRLLNRYRELVQLLEQLNTQLAELSVEQNHLLEEQQRLLKLLLGHQE